MTPTEREALIALLDKVPECKSPHITVMNTVTGKQFWSSNPNVNEHAYRLLDEHAAALARDAIREHVKSLDYLIKEWGTPGGNQFVQLESPPGTPEALRDRIAPSFCTDTSLLALIAAAYAVAGVKQ